VSATLEEIIWAVVVDHYIATAPQPPTRQGLALLANYLMDHLRSPGIMRNAREAASQCSAPWVENATLLQRRLREALVDFYKQSARPHPRIEDQARAFAETVIAEVGPEVESAALVQVERMQHLSEIEWQYAQAVEREAEIARNRRRPGRRALYPC
jgi:hypothetical protein